MNDDGSKADISPLNETELDFSKISKSWYDRRIAIGKWLNSYIDPLREMEAIEHRYYINKARSPGDRLTDAEKDRLSQYMLDIQDRHLRRAYFETTPIERTFQGLILPLLDKLIEHDTSIKQILNIGVNYAHIDWLLAKSHPDIQFTGIDFATNLAEFNEEFSRENLNFITGYTLELLEKGQLEIDVVMMSSVAYEIKNAEVRAYFKAVAAHGGYFVMNEPIYLLPGGAVVNPDEVPLEESKPVYSYAGPKRRQPGPLALVHNYRAMLEAEGFEILHFHVFRPEFTDLRMINVIAKAPTPSKK